MDGALTPEVYIKGEHPFICSLSVLYDFGFFLVVEMPRNLRVPALLGLPPMRTENREELARTPHHLDNNLSPNAKNVPWDALSTQTSVSYRRPFLFFTGSSSCSRVLG